MCDAHYRFLLVGIGGEGRQSDGGVISRSSLGQALTEGRLQFPSPQKFEQEVLPFALLQMKPFH